MTLLRPGMGTENALAVIAAMIRTVRPQSVLEIGAGDSSIAIVEALVSAVAERRRDQKLLTRDTWSERSELLSPAYIQQPYAPTFISVDNFSAEGCSAHEAWQHLTRYGDQGVTITTINTDFFVLGDPFYAAHPSFDCLWIDAGTLVDDVRFLGALWPRLAPGGLLFLHEPYATMTVRDAQGTQLAMARTPLWEQIVKERMTDVDLLSLPERHKYRQSGLGILRKREPWEAPRGESFQAEMMQLGEAPIRFSASGLGVPGAGASARAHRARRLLRNPQLRAVVYAVGLGASHVDAIQERTGVSRAQVVKILAKLCSAQMIECIDGHYAEVATFWQDSASVACGGPARELTDGQLTQSAILDRIVRHLQPNTAHSEQTLSRYCAHFTDDFARLRRALVDTGRLIKQGNTYTVPVRAPAGR